MIDPFSPAAIRKFDPAGVHRAYEKWPSLARAGFEVEFDLPRTGLHKAYVLGMGGSAAGGDIIASWLSEKPGIEMAVFKGQLPIGDLSDSLAIACSASGETEETIQMMKTAVRRGATVISVSGGGRLAQVSKRLRVPHVRMPEVLAPRYMLPFIIFSCLAIVNEGLELGCEQDAEAAFKEMEGEGKEIGIGVPSEKNPSKKLALAIMRKVPVIYGARATRGAGIRFKNVLNENAKKHALFDGLPDAFHNEIESWEDPSGEFAPVFLRHRSESKTDSSRADAMVRILSRMGRGPLQLRGRGESSLGQLVSLVYRLDMTSFYIAMGLERNPFPTRLIDKLKEEA